LRDLPGDRLEIGQLDMRERRPVAAIPKLFFSYGRVAMPAAELYLDLLKKILTNTLEDEEPDADNPNATAYVTGFIRHYIRGRAITMLPMARLNNLQNCVVDVIERGVPGDFIETGVWRGGATIFMRAILKAYDVKNRMVWVADSFEGLPEPDPDKFPTEAKYFASTNVQRHFDKFASSLEDVQTNFKMFDLLDDQVKFLKGWFKDTLPIAPINRLAVARLDGDYYESTWDGLVNLYDKLSVGGFIIVDDYGEDAWTNCRQAVDQFRSERGIREPLIAVDSKCSYWQRKV